jgi:hypothetical protein
VHGDVAPAALWYAPAPHAAQAAAARESLADVRGGDPFLAALIDSLTERKR